MYHLMMSEQYLDFFTSIQIIAVVLLLLLILLTCTAVADEP